MTKKKGLLIPCLVLLGCGIGFLSGWYANARFGSTSSSPGKPLPPYPSGQVTTFGSLVLNEGSELQVSTGADKLALMAKRAENGKFLDFVTLYDEKKPVLSTTLYPNGRVKEVRVMVSGKDRFARGFYEEGTVLFTSEFEYAPSRPGQETRQYYDKEGKPTKKEILSLHAG